MKLATKLILSYLLIAITLIGVGIYAYYSISRINQNGASMYENRVLPLGDLGVIGKLAENTRVNMLTSVRKKDQAYALQAENNLKQITTNIDRYNKHEMLADERESFDQFLHNWKDFETIARNNISLIKNGKFEEASEGVFQGAAPFTKASEYLDKLLKVNTAISEQFIKDNQQSFQRTSLFMLIVIVMSVILAIGIGIGFGRAITKPILLVCQQAALVAGGDLTVEALKIKSRDEIGQLANAFNNMTSHLLKTVRSVRQASEDLAASSEQLAASTEEVTAGIDGISHNTGQVAADAESGNQATVDASKVLLELSSLIQIAKEKAASAGNSSNETLAVASQGKDTVHETVSRMEKIKEKTIETEEMIATLDKYSKEIGSITDTITQLAAQTNLLALNAAIEAARAGEAGKGFAVVAAEVRKLADQSNQGANQVSELVNQVTESTKRAVAVTQQSREEVEAGVLTVTKAGKALENILEAVGNTVSHIEGIEEITKSEAATSEKIIELINSLASIIENTAANAEEVAASTEEASASMEAVASSAEESSAMATELNMMVSGFNI
jgi:methyl-accepting chemotaxis protein